MNRILILVLFWSVISCQNSPDVAYDNSDNHENRQSEKVEEVNTLPDSDAIDITYGKEIEGYDITVQWNPNSKDRGITTGPAELTFSKGTTTFKVTNNDFGLSSDALDMEYDDEDKVIVSKTKSISLEYSDFELEDNKLGYPETPFIFLDLNFDGKKEILLCQPGKGQRGRTTFSVLDSDGTSINAKPYDLLDSESQIDAQNKTLSVFTSGGACAGVTDVYQSVNGALQRTQTRKQNMKDGKCMESTYEVKDDKEKFISEKELK